MKKINTHQFYELSTSVHPLTELGETEKTTLGVIFFPLWGAQNALLQCLGPDSLLSASSKRAVAAVIQEINRLGISEDLGGVDFKKSIEGWQLTSVVQKTKDLETVLSNDLPGLDTYYVYRKGIYSTTDLIENADIALMEGLSDASRAVISDDTKRDFNQAGRCLAFELPTASGFHVMRSVESILRQYWRLVRKPACGTRVPEMAQCINELRSSGEDAKLMDILDHIRDLHRNTLMHPEAFLELREALRLFDIAKSAISAMAERIERLVADSLAASAVAGE